MDRTTLILVLLGLGLVGYWVYTMIKPGGSAPEGDSEPGTFENFYPVPTAPIRPVPVGYNPGYQNPGGGSPEFGLGAFDPCVRMPYLCPQIQTPTLQPVYPIQMAQSGLA